MVTTRDPTREEMERFHSYNLINPSLLMESEKLLISQSFSYFVKDFWSVVPGAGQIVWNWHMDVICQELQRISDRVSSGLPREHDLVLNVPFGTSKSTIISILFPAWVWSFMPSARFITASHTDGLVTDLAAKSRWVIKSEKYQSLWPNIQLREDQDTKSHFANTLGGSRLACTVGGKTPTGFHAHFLLVDDPIDPQGARSEAELETSSKFMTEILPSRVVDKSVSVTVLIMQRLHFRDPTAVMMDIAKKEGATPVRRVCIPGELTEDVEPAYLRDKYIDGLMDVNRLPWPVLKRYQATLGTYGYAGQVLQKPIPPGGGMFKEQWFNRRVRAAPYNAKRIRFWDRASTADGGCYSAGVLMAKDSEGNFYVEHVVHGQWEPDDRNQKMRATALRDRTRYGPNNEPSIYVEAEGGSSGRDAWKGVVRALAGFSVREERVTGSKDVRAEPWSTQLAAGNVMLVEDGTWDINNYIQEHTLFRPDPTTKRLGKYKDQVDASCLVAGSLIKTIDGLKPIEKVVDGDLVLTRQGYKRVDWSGQTGISNSIVSVLFANGSVVSGTPNHMVWTETRGWITLDSLLGEDYTVTSPNKEEELSWLRRESKLQRQYNLMELTTIDEKEKSIFGQCCGMGRGGFQIHSIEQYGDIVLETSPLVMIFTTRTKTHRTTRLRILNAYLRRNTGGNIEKLIGLLNNSPILKRFVSYLQSGTDLKKGENGIESMGSKLGREERNIPVHALGVGNRSYLDVQYHQSIVPVDVTIEKELRLAAEKHKKNVQYVESHSWENEEQDVVLESVELSGDGKQSVKVYDLKVRDAHEFFADGILVHNSGAFNLLCGMGITGPLLRVFNFRDKRKSKYTRGPRLIAGSKEAIAAMIIEERALLVSIIDPEAISFSSREDGYYESKKEEVQIGQEDRELQGFHGQEIGISCGTEEADGRLQVSGVVQEVNQFPIGKLLDRITIQFADISSEEVQDRWQEPVEPWGRLPEELILTQSQCKKLWAFLIKKRDPWPEVIVFQDNGDRRGISIALAVADAMQLPRESCVTSLNNYDNKKVEEYENKHVYSLVKSSRGMVL